MDARIIRLEERTDLFGKQLDRIITRLDAMDARFDALYGRFDTLYGRLDAMNERMSRLPSKDFLIATVAIILGAAIGIAALTFQIADYVGSRPTPAGPAAPAPAAAQQPLVIVIPPWQAQQAVPLAPAPTPAQPGPAIAPEPSKP